jgi:hypothetical protein
VVIGVHSPEFAFEKNIDNVKQAVASLMIDYPIAIDNNYAIWRSSIGRRIVSSTPRALSATAHSAKETTRNPSRSHPSWP